MPFAQFIQTFPSGSLQDEATKYINSDKGISDVAAVLRASMKFLRSNWENAGLRDWVRHIP